jgi:hypothetical protein
MSKFKPDPKCAKCKHKLTGRYWCAWFLSCKRFSKRSDRDCYEKREGKK